MSHSPSPRPSRTSSRTAPAAALPACPVERAITIIGGKWKMLVLRSLLLNGPQRYNQLLVSVGGISPKELSRNIRELTRSSLIAPLDKRGAPYALSSRGSELMPVFKRLLLWGRRLIETPPG